MGLFSLQQPANLDKILDPSWEKERERGLLTRETRERGEKESGKDSGRNSSPGSVNREQTPQLSSASRPQDDSRQHSPTSLRMPHSPDMVGQVPGTPNPGNVATSSPTALPPVNQMIMSPSTSLHHMQQLLQQHVLTPNQLQSLMKQHSMYLQQSQHQQHPVSTRRLVLFHQLIYKYFITLNILYKYFKICGLINITKIVYFFVKI